MCNLPARRFACIAPVAVVLLAVALTAHRIEDFDTWFHLAAGRLMFGTGTWPTHNTFSLTAPDYPWIDLHWLFQLLLYTVWLLTGVNGIIVLACVLVAAMSLVLYGLARRSVPPMAAAFLMAVALTISCTRFVPRPELLSFLYFAIYLVVLESYPRYRRTIYLLVPLQILWVNTHGIFAVGLALMGCYWLGATLAFLPLPRGWRQVSGLSVADWRRLSAVLGLATLACVVNPWGIDGALFPLQLLPRVTGNWLFASRISEFRAPLQSGYAPPLVYMWLALLFATGLSFLLNPRRWHLGRLLAVVAFGLLSVQALRNVAFFGWLAVPAIAANVGPLLERWRLPSRLRAGLAISTLVGVVLLIGSIVTNRFSHALAIDREAGFGISRTRFSAQAIAFAERTGIGGRAFGCLAMGGYLIWNRPQDRVFVDGRLETYPEDVFRTYFQVMDKPASWTPAVGPYAVDYVFLYHAWSNRLPLVRQLVQDRGWTLVYYDEIASIFLPNDEPHRAVRERAQSAFAEVRAARQAAAQPAPPSRLPRSLFMPVAENFRHGSYGGLLGNIGLSRESITAYQQALAIDPDQVDVRYSLGIVYWRDGQRDAAIHEWQEALRLAPDDVRVKKLLARTTGAAKQQKSER